MKKIHQHTFDEKYLQRNAYPQSSIGSHELLNVSGVVGIKGLPKTGHTHLPEQPQGLGEGQGHDDDLRAGLMQDSLLQTVYTFEQFVSLVTFK